MSHGGWGKKPRARSIKAVLFSLTLVTIIMSGLDLFGLDLVIHRLHKIAWIVGSDDILLGCRDDLT